MCELIDLQDHNKYDIDLLSYLIIERWRALGLAKPKREGIILLFQCNNLQWLFIVLGIIILSNTFLWVCR